MKKYLSVILALSLIFSLSATAFAAEAQPISVDFDINNDYTSDGTISCREMSFEEVIARKMAYDNISYTEAKERLLAEENQILEELGGEASANRTVDGRSGNIISYLDYQKEFKYSANQNFTGVLEAVIVLVSDYGYSKWIQDVQMVFSRRVAGLYVSEWVERGTNVTISDDKKSARISASGYFKTIVDISGAGSVNLPGFSLSASVDTGLIYLSETIKPTGTYYAP